MCLILNWSLEQFCNKATDVAFSIEFISENCELWLINEHSKTIVLIVYSTSVHSNMLATKILNVSTYLCGYRVMNIVIIRFALALETIMLVLMICTTFFQLYYNFNEKNETDFRIALNRKLSISSQ